MYSMLLAIDYGNKQIKTITARHLYQGCSKASRNHLEKTLSNMMGLITPFQTRGFPTGRIKQRMTDFSI